MLNPTTPPRRTTGRSAALEQLPLKKGDSFFVSTTYGLPAKQG